jgi:hypothetical protein
MNELLPLRKESVRTKFSMILNSSMYFKAINAPPSSVTVVSVSAPVPSYANIKTHTLDNFQNSIPASLKSQMSRKNTNRRSCNPYRPHAELHIVGQGLLVSKGGSISSWQLSGPMLMKPVVVSHSFINVVCDVLSLSLSFQSHGRLR